MTKMRNPDLLEKAIRLAVRAHEGQMRKSPPIPYITHPIAVGIILAEHGFSDEVIAAGLTHDVLEDTSITREELRAELGETVLLMVEAVSEDKSIPWEERKKTYIAKVAKASDEVKAISLADKIHNARSMRDSIKMYGEATWKFFTRGKEAQLKLLGEYQRCFSSWSHPMVEEYQACIREIKALG